MNYNYQQIQFHSTIILSGLKSQLISGSIDKTAKVWNIDSGQCVKTMKQGGPINSVKTSLGEYDLISSKSFEPILLDHIKNMTETVLSSDKGISSSTLSMDGSIALLGTKNGNIKVIETKTKRNDLIILDNSEREESLYQLLKSNAYKIFDCSRSIKNSKIQFNNLIISLTKNLNFKEGLKKIKEKFNLLKIIMSKIYNARSKFEQIKSLFILTKMSFAIKSISISDNNKLIVTAMDKFIQITERETGNLINKIYLKSEIKIAKIQKSNFFSKESIVIGCTDGIVQIYSMDGKILNTIVNSFAISITSLQIDDDQMIVGSTNGYAFIYDLFINQLMFMIYPDNYESTSVGITSVFLSTIVKTSPLIQIGYEDGLISVYGFNSRQKIREIRGHKDSVSSIDIIRIEENINMNVEKEDSQNQENQPKQLNVIKKYIMF